VEYAIDKEAIAKAFGYGYRVAPYQIPPRASTAYDPNFTLNRKYDLEKAKQLLVEAGHPDGLDTTILQWANPAIQDITIAMQADLAKAGIRAQLKFIDSGEWMASYAGPNGKWPTGTMIFSPVPRFDRSFIGGLNFLSTMIGQSWLRTPEWTQAYNAALAAPAADIQLIRAVTDIITRDASIIPVTELGSVGTKKPYVMLERDQRAFMSFGKPEEVWMNK
jgi:ABC-type transport system substrate-binding protein